ncbi:hypothetical protein [Nioella nitratireducens]|uniref:hypothetical protein n=1 Tax=Nioella nitratireducens TaxID=1287720 RepID=UPI001314586A|nr:hypothetical protein [Nioella nitratireducens]
MTRLALTHVAYDARRACFRAEALVDDTRRVSCRWHGPQGASFPRIADGLAKEARRHMR